MRLRERAKHPPGGYRYTVAQTNWSISPWISFDAAVQQIIAHRRANPYQAQVNGWSLDPQTVADELDAFNAKVCQEMGWNQYIGPGDPPKSKAPQSLLSLSAQVAAGAKAIAEWEIEGGTLVPQELAEQRGATCSSCPKNASGDLLSWFTVPAAELIKKQLEGRNNMKIHTNSDPLLGVCECCACPLKLMIHIPLEIKLSKLRSEDKAKMPPHCWVVVEEAALHAA